MYDSRRVLTKRKLLAALKDIPDDVPILINVEFKDGENWDTWNSWIVNMSYMCPVNPDCSHTEPEMDWQVVLAVKFGDDRGIMEPDWNKD
jgi:hypothetical protein